MARTTAAVATQAFPAPAAVLELLKPITWFPPMWAFFCGVVSAGADVGARWPLLLAGIVLTGPLVCGMSQAVNDWFDRHVDAINQPERPVPSGRIPGRWALWIAIAWTGLSLLLAAALGVWVLAATVLGCALAWAYSAPPFRLKQSGWWGPLTVAVAYEGLTWFTGASIMLGALPGLPVLLLLGLYSLGAHGIMTLNDFKAVEGDRATGVRSLPVQLGVDGAARLACAVMIAPQLVVVALLFGWDRPWHAAVVAAMTAAQGLLMLRLLRDPRRHAPWYNATGTTLYVLGMLVAAFAAGSLSGELP
jgi:chlorophyll/bacteriochlorophyll a synthase